MYIITLIIYNLFKKAHIVNIVNNSSITIEKNYDSEKSVRVIPLILRGKDDKQKEQRLGHHL